MLAEVEAEGDTRGDRRALVDTVADTLAVVEAIGETPGDERALVDTLADTLTLVQAVTLGDARVMRTHWSNSG